tara:strand:- start:910 stop:1860 length:951 start_codon:yes stop_codon:yes gene_type:complete
MIKFFISGGAGFIGSQLCEKIYTSFPRAQLIIYDKLTYAGNLKFLDKIIRSNRVKFIKGDIIDYKKYSKYLKNINFAINVAAESHVDRSFKNSLLFTRSNTLGAHTFVQSCIENNVKKILQVSTDEVYGQTLKGQKNEQSLMNPTNPYSASKAAAEIIINSYKFFESDKILTVRGNNIYGVRQFPEKLIPSCIVNLIKNKKIQLNGDGKHERCYLSAKDFAAGIVLLLKKNKKGIYNIGNDIYYKNYQVAKIICGLMKKNYKDNVVFIPDRPFNDRRYSISINKIKKLGWSPKNQLVKDLPGIINWYKKNLKIFKY